jgi:predicted glycosyltransferase
MDEGHDVLITGRKKDILLELASEYNFDIKVLSTAKTGLANMVLEVIQHQFRLMKLIKTFKPDALLAIAGTFIALPGFLTRTPTYVFYDTEHATISNLLAYPFASCVYVPNCYRKKIRWNHERYNGYHELTYLHPDVFVPDQSVLEEAGLQQGEPFSIVRFVAWEAAHDRGLQGITLENKIRAVDELNKFGRVFVVSENELPADLESYRCLLPVSRMHQLMAYASLIFGESATMVAEGAVLGVPGVYIDPIGRGYTDEQESEYGMVFNFTHQQQEQSIAKAVEIVSSADKKIWQERCSLMLADKIDVNSLLYRVVMDLPHVRNTAVSL